jgi:hypothetical protein
MRDFLGLRRDSHKLLLGGAWLFSMGSLLPLLWLAGENGGVSRVFGAQADGVQHSVWGLTYSGVLGSILLWIQILGLLGANVASVLPQTRWRRIGHAYLVGWAGLWALGALYLATVSPVFWLLQSVFQFAFLGCVRYRAARWWNTPPMSLINWPKKEASWTPRIHPGTIDTDAAADRDELLNAMQVQSNGTLTEIHGRQGNRSKSTLPPDKITPTRERFGKALKSLESAAAKTVALLGSTTSFMRSKISRIAATMRSSETVKTRST